VGNQREGGDGRKATPRAIFGGDLGASTVTANRYLIALSTRSTRQASRALHSTLFEPPIGLSLGIPAPPSNGSQPGSTKGGLTWPTFCHHPSSCLDSLPAAQLDPPRADHRRFASGGHLPQDSGPKGIKTARPPAASSKWAGSRPLGTGVTHLAVSLCWFEGFADTPNRQEWRGQMLWCDGSSEPTRTCLSRSITVRQMLGVDPDPGLVGNR
jgi:hypothetical protein